MWKILILLQQGGFPQERGGRLSVGCREPCGGEKKKEKRLSSYQRAGKFVSQQIPNGPLRWAAMKSIGKKGGIK